ncbi:hypothetical protein AURDEDRAFT_168911 [Auricularia subglabra TFB-10046 SS5]|nr:hypothetical protein AURDEDRAFT_168911 [Auricularia subglabra TFB-10046 SS5]
MSQHTRRRARILAFGLDDDAQYDRAYYAQHALAAAAATKEGQHKPTSATKTARPTARTSGQRTSASTLNRTDFHNADDLHDFLKRCRGFERVEDYINKYKYDTHREAACTSTIVRAQNCDRRPRRCSRDPDCIVVTGNQLEDFELTGVAQRLDKTAQSVVYLLYLFHRMRPLGPFPVIVLPPWRATFLNWAPDLVVFQRPGSKP